MNIPFNRGVSTFSGILFMSLMPSLWGKFVYSDATSMVTRRSLGYSVIFFYNS